MKTETLENLVETWTEKAKAPEVEDGSPEAAESRARARGFREGLAKAANDLKALLYIFEN